MSSSARKSLWTKRREFWPSVLEVQRAKQIFIDTVKHYADSQDMTNETIITCALAEVWRQGRIYQRDKGATA